MQLKDPDFQSIFEMYFEKMITTNSKIQSFLSTFVENRIITSDLNIVKRITATETVTGLTDYPDIDGEECGLTIPDQISLLSEKVMNLEESVQNKPVMKSDTVLTTKTEN